MQDGPVYLTNNDLNVLTSTKQISYGTRGVTGDGREFRYVSFGGTTTIAPGLVVTAPVITNSTAGYQGVAITATTVTGANQTSANLATNSTQIVLTNSTSSVITQDQFAEGYLDIIVGGASSDTGHYTYKIKGNTAAGAGNSTATYYTVFTVAEEPFRNTTALVPGTDTASLTLPVWSTVNTNGSTQALPIGLTVMPVVNTASVTNYGWVQTNGPATVLNDTGGTITVGGAFGQSAAVAGNVKAATASTAPIIGFTRVAISASTAGPAYLTLN